jgi:hypothetical protein
MLVYTSNVTAENDDVFIVNKWIETEFGVCELQYFSLGNLLLLGVTTTLPLKGPAMPTPILSGK